MNYHIGRIVPGSMCVGVSVWLGWSGIRVAGAGAWGIQETHETVSTNYCFYTYTTPPQYLGEFEGIRAKPKQGKVFSKEFYLQSRSVCVSFIICGDVPIGDSMGDCKP